MIAGAILVVAAIIAKIWGIITGGGSGDSGGGGGGGSPEVKKEAMLLFSKFLTSASLQIKPTTVKLLLAFIIFIF
jgi:hypothetical protein